MRLQPSQFQNQRFLMSPGHWKLLCLLWTLSFLFQPSSRVMRRLFQIIVAIVKRRKETRKGYGENDIYCVEDPTAISQKVLDKMPQLRIYEPTWWMGPHLQTFWTAKWRCDPDPPIEYRRELIQVDEEGGKVSLDWHMPAEWGKKTLILVHGLVGGSQEVYIKWMVAKAASHCMTAVVMNARGCGDTPLFTPQCFSAAWTEDLRVITKVVRERIGNHASLFAVGFSLGAGILSKYLCEEGEVGGHQLVTAAACLSGSFDLVKSTKTIEQFPYKQTYNRKLASNLVNFVRRHESVLKRAPWLDLEDIARSTSVREFDSKTIVPMFGFRDVWHYYASASTADRIDLIKTPTLIVNSKDDVVCDAFGLDISRVRQNPNLLAVHTEEGGHVAWSEGFAPSGESWIDRTCCEFFEVIAKLRGFT